MTTFKTGNPIGSTAVKDLYDNAENFDRAVNGDPLSWKDRLGNTRRSWSSIENSIEDVRANANAAIASLGYQVPVPYAAGIEMTLANQTVSYDGDTYAPIASELPFTTSGTFEADKFRLIQGVSGADLAAPYGAAMVGFLQDGYGATLRASQDKMRDVISVKDYGAIGDGSTSDQAAIVAAVTAAITRSADLLWPAGTYVSTHSIPGLHSVRHRGKGCIKRGVMIFFPDPPRHTENVLYVSATTLVDGDGLDETTPIRTLQSGIDALTNYGPVLDGTWALQLFDETYARGRFPDEGLLSQRPIEIRGVDVGGHPNVPQTKISEGDNGITAEAIRFRRNTKVKCSDILFVGFNGSTSSAGISPGGFCEIYSVNCHFENCTWGISGIEHSIIDVKGGVFEGNGFEPSGSPYSSGGAIRGLFLTKFSVGLQSAGNRGNGPFFFRNNFGIFAQEHIDGHVDWCVFDENRTHVRLNVLSRLNLGGSSFKRAVFSAIWTQEGSIVSLNEANEFGTGAESNHINIINNTGAATPPGSLIDELGSLASSERCVARRIVNQTINSTNNTVIFSMTLKPQLWRDGLGSASIMKKIRFKMIGTLNGSTGFKRPQMRFGNTQVNITFTAADTGAFECEGAVFIGTNPVGAQVQTIKGFNHFGPNVRISTNEPSETMESETVFNIEGVVESSDNSMLIRAFEVWVDGI